MTIIPCKVHHLEERIRERGATWDAAKACIVRQDGDSIDVDVDHPAYPRAKGNAKPIDMSCRHRGGVVGETQCPSCAGVVMAKLYGCQIHQTCTLFSKPIDGAKACRSCADRQSGG